MVLSGQQVYRYQEESVICLSYFSISTPIFKFVYCQCKWLDIIPIAAKIFGKLIP